MSKPIVAIVGRPNVGKSTLFNVLAGETISIVKDTPGVTRDRIYADCTWLNMNFTLVDTGGIEPDSRDVILSQMREQAEIAIATADVIVFIVDVRQGLVDADSKVADMLRRSRKPVVLAVNKVDSFAKFGNDVYEFYNLGIGEPIPISAASRLGLGELLDAVSAHFDSSQLEEDDDDRPRIAIVGKPNVGKSSIINKLTGENRVIVSDIAGTTRDAVDTTIVHNGTEYVFIDTAGYALKQVGSDGAIQSIADSFAAYFGGGEESPEPLHEPVSFLILPFLPGAAGMALVRLLGGGALACLYAGRLGNLLAYTLLCGAALHLARRYRPVLLCVMLLPLSLFMGASLSYDATLLACYYLMLALLTRPVWTTRTAAAYAAACVFVNVAKPYLNLLWALLPLVLLAADAWRARGRRWLWSAAMAAGALAATLGVETYGRLLRRNYPVIARQGGQAVDGMAQLLFVLRNPLRTLATFWGTLYENEGFVGQLGIFGWKDLPIPLLNLLGPVALGLAVLLASAQPAGLGRRRTLGLGGFGAVYAAGAMAAMYITYTPVAMVRIVGLQARYFLPVFLALALVAVAPLRRLLAPQLPLPRAERLAVPLFAGHALLGAVLLFQHYFVGPFYTIPA